jgi:hypothetical protein
VILGSFDYRPKADARLRLVRRQGVKDARLIDNQQYRLGTRWAVYSGVFRTEDEAKAHMQELSQLGITELFVKSVNRAD